MFHPFSFLASPIFKNPLGVRSVTICLLSSVVINFSHWMKALMRSCQKLTTVKLNNVVHKVFCELYFSGRLPRDVLGTI